jgi:hypothetical protein
MSDHTETLESVIKVLKKYISDQATNNPTYKSSDIYYELQGEFTDMLHESKSDDLLIPFMMALLTRRLNGSEDIVELLNEYVDTLVGLIAWESKNLKLRGEILPS